MSQSDMTKSRPIGPPGNLQLVTCSLISAALTDAVLRASQIVGEQAADNFVLHISHQQAAPAVWAAWLDQVMDKLMDHVEMQLQGWGVTGEQEVLLAQIAASESFFARFSRLWQGGLPPQGSPS